MAIVGDDSYFGVGCNGELVSEEGAADGDAVGELGVGHPLEGSFFFF